MPQRNNVDWEGMKSKYRGNLVGQLAALRSSIGRPERMPAAPMQQMPNIERPAMPQMPQMPAMPQMQMPAQPQMPPVQQPQLPAWMSNPTMQNIPGLPDWVRNNQMPPQLGNIPKMFSGGGFTQ